MRKIFNSNIDAPLRMTSWLFASVLFLCSACIERETDFGKPTSHKGYLYESNETIVDIFWPEPNRIFIIVQGMKHSMKEIDLTTKEASTILPAVGYPLTAWISGGGLYMVTAEQEALVRYDLITKQTAILAENVDGITKVIHEAGRIVFVKREDYNVVQGGPQVYLFDETTAMERPIGFGYPKAISPDGTRVLVSAETQPQRRLMEIDLATNQSRDFGSWIPSQLFYDCIWSGDKAVAIVHNNGWLVSTVDLNTGFQMGSMAGALRSVSYPSLKLVVNASNCTSLSCRQKWVLTDLSFTNSDELVSGAGLVITKFEFSPDENSVVYCEMNRLYTKKLE